MEKRIINKFGKHYLLGINRDGEYVWLEKESWDCDWYWGLVICTLIQIMPIQKKQKILVCTLTLTMSF